MQMKVRAIRACYLNDQLFTEGQEAVIDLPEDHPMLDHFEVLSPKKRAKAAPATQAPPVPPGPPVDPVAPPDGGPPVDPVVDDGQGDKEPTA